MHRPGINAPFTIVRDPGSAVDEGLEACRFAAIAARSPGVRTPEPPSFLGLSFCLPAPEGRPGVCAWALRGGAETEPQERPTGAKRARSGRIRDKKELIQ